MKLHIGNLPKTLTEPQLRDMVVAIAEPSTVELVKDSAGESRGYGFADFSSDENASAVLKGLDGKEVGGQTLKVGEARPRKSDARTAAPRP